MYNFLIVDIFYPRCSLSIRMYVQKTQNQCFRLVKHLFLLPFLTLLAIINFGPQLMG